MGKLGRRALALLLACLSLFVIAACGDDDDGGGGSSGGGDGEAKKGGSITISQTSQPDYMDPALTYTVNGIEPLWLVYTPLITYAREEGQPGAKLIPGLAEDLPEISEDGLTYKLTLRKGLKYSDGSPVKAADFEHTIKRVLNLESGGSAFYLVIDGAQEYLDAGKPDGDISGIETNDDTGKITITLTEPDGSFSHVLAMWFAALVPSDTPFKNMTENPPPGVGPYKVTESVPNRQFVLERNAEYDKNPIEGIPSGNIDTITTKIVKSAQRQAQDVISGNLDYMQDPPPADLKPEVKAKYSDRYVEQTTASTYYFFMNTRVPPFDDPKVRDGGVYFQTIGNAKTRAQTGFANWFQDFPHPKNFMFLVDGKSIQPTNNQNFGNVDDPEITKGIAELNQEPKMTDDVAAQWGDLNKKLVERGWIVPYGHRKLATFLSERMDFDNCSRFHPVYFNDYSSFCLK